MTDDNQAKAYRIMLNEEVVGGMILKIDRQNAKYELEILFIKPGQAAWKAVEILHHEISVWETMTLF